MSKTPFELYALKLIQLYFSILQYNTIFILLKTSESNKMMSKPWKNISMSYKAILKFSLISILLCNACKKKEEDVITDVPQTSNADAVFASFQMMHAAADRFIEIGDSMNITPPEALSSKT